MEFKTGDEVIVTTPLRERKWQIGTVQPCTEYQDGSLDHMVLVKFEDGTTDLFFPDWLEHWIGE